MLMLVDPKPVIPAKAGTHAEDIPQTRARSKFYG
jgi:hypothetical protein